MFSSDSRGIGDDGLEVKCLIRKFRCHEFGLRGRGAVSLAQVLALWFLDPLQQQLDVVKHSKGVGIFFFP